MVRTHRGDGGYRHRIRRFWVVPVFCVAAATVAVAGPGSPPAGGVVDFGCDFAVVPSGDVGVTWDAAEDRVVVVERSDSGGPWSVVFTGGFADGAEYLDTASPTSASDYRVTPTDGGVPGTTVTCEEVTYAVGLDSDDVPEIPRTSGGDIGGSGAGAVVPTSIPTPPSVPSSNPATAPSLCGALSGPGGAGAGGAVRHSVRPATGPVYTRVTLPAQTYLEFDVMNDKAPFTDNGNWIWDVDLFLANPDGTLGSAVDGVAGTTPYYWDGRTILTKDRSVDNTATISRDFFIRTSSPTVVSINTSTAAGFSLMDVSIKRLSDHEVVGRPCDEAAVVDCAAQGGDYYFAAPTMVDGQELLGCQEYHSCVTDLSPNLDLIVTDLNGIAHWACENDDLLEAALAVGLVVVVILGVVYFAPSAPAAVAALRGLLAAEAGHATIQQVTITGLGALVVVGGAYVATISPERLDDLTESLPDISLPSLGTNTQTGQLTITSAAVAEQVYARSDYDQAIRPSDPQPVRSVHRQLIIRALQTCLATLTIGQAQEIADQYAPGHVVTSISDFVVALTEGPRHLCEMATLYLPGGITRTTARPIGQATAHINEVLFDDPPIATETHTGSQPPLPRPEWMYLNRAVVERERWYNDPPYSCAATVSPTNNDCDEWPWQATTQGGEPGPGDVQPHLRIINRSDNRVAGREYQTFLSNCEVEPGGGFFVVPSPTPLFIDDWNPDSPVGPVPSTWIGPDCRW